jgi:hypothetical protein
MPRRSIREGVQAPAARRVRDAVSFFPEVRRTPETVDVSCAIRRRDTVAVMKDTRPVASIWVCSQRMHASASAHPAARFRYPDVPDAPSRPHAVLISVTEERGVMGAPRACWVEAEAAT